MLVETSSIWMNYLFRHIKSVSVDPSEMSPCLCKRKKKKEKKVVANEILPYINFVKKFNAARIYKVSFVLGLSVG